MNKVIFLLAILFVQFLRYGVSRYKDGDKLLISFYVISIPFQFAIPLYLPNIQSGGGTLGPNISIYLPLVLCMVVLTAKKFRLSALAPRRNKWAAGIFALLLISVFNPFNEAPISTIAMAIFLGSHYLFLVTINSVFKPDRIFEGIYDGLAFLSIIQLALAICFPVLQLSFVTRIFYADAATWATRNGTRLGAVGVFTHPGNLALFSAIAASCFASCYVSRFKAKSSLILLAMTAVTIFLTYSRTTYLTFLFILILIYFIHKNPKATIFSIPNILKFIIPAAAILYWVIYYSPLSDEFLNSDADSMYTARFTHWLIAIKTFQASPWFGVGLNAHLEHISHHTITFSNVAGGYNEFLMSNPIHNIHLIILAEIGVLGAFVWILFIMKSLAADKGDIAKGKNVVLSLSHIGVISAFIIYGVTGWAPLSPGILPFLILISYQSMIKRIPLPVRKKGNLSHIPHFNHNSGVNVAQVVRSKV